MYQIKIGDQTFDLSCITVDRDSCIIQTPGKYNVDEIKNAFASGLDFTVLVSVQSTAKTGETTVQTAEYPYTGYVRAGDPEKVTINNAQRIQVVLYKSADEPGEGDDLAEKMASLESDFNGMVAAIERGLAL